ncbi:MAG: hypothetical protein ACFFES_16695 [Candidatus Thorarchaeota archaeon]
MNKRILLNCGSLGLGHVTRDIAIANEIRSNPGEADIHWSSANPVSLLLEKRGTPPRPEASGYLDENHIAKLLARGLKPNLFRFAVAFQRQRQHNIDPGVRVTTRDEYGLPFGDETYDLVTAFIKARAGSSLPLSCLAILSAWMPCRAICPITADGARKAALSTAEMP